MRERLSLGRKEERVLPEEARVAARGCAAARGTVWHRSRCRRAVPRQSSDGKDPPSFERNDGVRDGVSEQTRRDGACV